MTTNAADKIIAYIKKNRVVGLCTVRDCAPWAASCFYAFDDEAMELVFMSEFSTRHGGDLLANRQVAGTISSQQSNVAQLRGIQFTGCARLLSGPEHQKGRVLFLRRFPVAAVHPAPLWAISLEIVKYTNNTLGFGTKLRWMRDDDGD